MTAPLLTAHLLSKSHGHDTALEDVSFTLKAQETVGLLGLNGAGKSTLMQLLAGTLAADSGEIVIAGANLRMQPVKARAELGFLPDQPPLYPNMRVKDYVHYSAQLRGIKQDLQQRVETVIEECGLADVKEQSLNALSKGYQQRVGIAQAIVHAPKLIILDEPTVGLDPSQAQQIRSLLISLKAQHTILISSHILSDINTLCDRALVLHQGRLIHESTLQQLSPTTLFVQFYQTIPTAQLQQQLGEDSVITPYRDGWQITAPNLATLSAQICSIAHQNHWTIQHLQPQKNDLEALFLNLVTKDEA